MKIKIKSIKSNNESNQTKPYPNQTKFKFIIFPRNQLAQEVCTSLKSQMLEKRI